MTQLETKTRRGPISWRNVLVEFVVLTIFWLLLSGHYDAFHIGLGIGSVALVIWMDRSLSSSLSGRTGEQVHLRPVRLLLYLPWLLVEMLLSALHVARVTLSPRAALDPVMVRFRSDQPSDEARVLLGNSITLTPGTLTIDIDGNEYLVHALSSETADGLALGRMQRKVARLFVDEPEAMVHDVRLQRQAAGGRRYQDNP